MSSCCRKVYKRNAPLSIYEALEVKEADCWLQKFCITNPLKWLKKHNLIRSNKGGDFVIWKDAFETIERETKPKPRGMEHSVPLTKTTRFQKFHRSSK